MLSKRKHPESNQPATSDGPPSDKRPNIQDSYCFLCHQKKTNLHCSTCIRSYHDQCAGSKATKLQPFDYRCETCIRLESAKSHTATKFTGTSDLNRLLHFATERLINDVEVRMSMAIVQSYARNPVKHWEYLIISSKFPIDFSSTHSTETSLNSVKRR